MGYYITKISVSLSCKNDKEAIDKIDELVASLNNEKGIKPYVEEISVATNNSDPKKRFSKLDSSSIKNLNIKK